MKILVIGASGMLGNAMCEVLLTRSEFEVIGVIRNENQKRLFSSECQGSLLALEFGEFEIELEVAITRFQPDVVINCVSPRGGVWGSSNFFNAQRLLAFFPHWLSRLCFRINSRLIHISSDGVFSGAQGQYTETDFPDALDVYGRLKILGEPSGDHVVNIRTSIIGHELIEKSGLLEWFLRQENSCRGYTRVIFSGMSTIDLSRAVSDIVIKDQTLRGCYHIGSTPISKYDLLCKVAFHYDKTIDIIRDDTLISNRSLNTSLFSEKTGYIAPDWNQQLSSLRNFYLNGKS